MAAFAPCLFNDRPRCGQAAAWLAALLWALTGGGAAAQDAFQFHGFASQGYLLSTNNNFFGDSSDGGSFEFTELGVNASWRPRTDLLLSGQLLSRRAGESDEGNVRVDFGFADYTAVSTLDDRWGVRLGRVKNPLGLYNETRDVASTRPGILLPQSIYFDRSRTFGLAADGVQLYGERRTPMGDFYLQAGVGLPQTRNDDLEVTIFTRDLPGEFEGEPSLIGRLLYEWEGGRVRAALSYADVTLDFEPVPPLPGGSFNFEPLIASLQFNGERWSLTSEYARRASRLRGLGIGGGGTDFTGESYYFQATYRLPHDWEALLRYDVFFADRDDREGRRFAAQDPLRRPDHSRFAKDWTLGLNWNLTPQFSLRAEWHHVDGTGWLTIQDNPDLRATERRWNLLAILASYRF